MTEVALDVPWALEWMRRGADVFAEHRAELIELDRRIGDGDHGENMHRGFSAVRRQIDDLDEQPQDVGEVLRLVATTLMSTVGGAAGPLFGTALLRAGAAAGVPVLDGAGVAAALQAALDGVAARGRAVPGEKTMVDALVPAARAAQESAAAGGSGREVLHAAAEAAWTGAAATEPLRATKGRASYLGERSVGHQDPGAVSVALLLRAGADAAGPVRAPAGAEVAPERSGAPVVALVLVSHSTTLADGLADLARQMAPDVLVLPAGGADDGTLGTSAARIGVAVEQATADGASAVVLSDLGSAVLTTDMVLELHDPQVAARVRQAHAPFVEGTVAAAVAAQGGADVEAVHQAAVDAGRGFGPAGIYGAGGVGDGTPDSATDGAITRTVVLPNPLGLHARPAAVLSRMVARFDAQVEVDGANAASVLELMRLAAPGGRQLVVTATGPEAQRAVDAVVTEIEGGFGEI